MNDPIYPVGTKLYVFGEKRAYKVRASDSNFVIATKPHFGTVLYFICDFKNNLRGPDSQVFSNGYETDEDCLDNLKDLNGELHEGHTLEISYRSKVPLVGVFDHEIHEVILPDGSIGKTPREILYP